VYSETIVGRAPELATVSEFVSAADALMLTGGPGIGKTTLWEAGIAIAREYGWRVLSARPNGAEAEVSFAALTDLFDGVETGALDVRCLSALRWRWRCCAHSRPVHRPRRMRSRLAS
jgi:hypothetical protein